MLPASKSKRANIESKINMSLKIISKDNKDHVRPEKKRYIILDQKERMYFSKGGLFVSDKKFALPINRQSVAAIACTKVNELRESQKQKTLCTVIYE